MNQSTALAIDWIEQGRVPDALIRAGARRLLRERLAAMDRAPVAPMPEKANEQHYALPPAFFAGVLGPHMKYSACYWPDGVTTLADAERAALAATGAHADVRDGQRILDLGCGWGSLTLWLAERLPRSRITAVSNSHSQRAYIEAQAAARKLANVEVITCDMNRFEPSERYDRVVSVEMFEHMRNWRLLLARIHDWLVPGGRSFIHVFCHRSTPYAFVDAGPGDWMSRHFFSGGMMPSDDLALRFQDHLRLVSRWRWSGRHYARTAEAWLANMDRGHRRLWPIVRDTYGERAAARWWNRWRVFFIACAELFGCDHGQQWWVSHYLFERRPGS